MPLRARPLKKGPFGESGQAEHEAFAGRNPKHVESPHRIKRNQPFGFFHLFFHRLLNSKLLIQADPIALSDSCANDIVHSLIQGQNRLLHRCRPL